MGRSAHGNARPGRYLALALLGAVALTSGCRAEQVPIGEGRTLFLHCTGEGSPTVILEGGWAADHTAWARVQPALARLARTCSYDRAGTGQSPAGPMPRSSAAVAADLLRALDSAGIGGPVIIVGHSIGAVHARALARLAPRRVAGLVLLDPTVEAMAPAGLAPFIARASGCLADVSNPESAVEPGLATRCPVRPAEQPVVTWSHRVSELEHLFPLPGQVAAGQERPPRVVVLTAGADLETPSGQWRLAQHRLLAQAYALGRHEVVESSGHMMMRDAPEAVVGAVRALVLDARVADANRPAGSGQAGDKPRGE